MPAAETNAAGSAIASAGRISQRTGRTNAPARTATPAAMTTPATTASPPTPAAQNAPTASTQHRASTPRPMSAVRAIGPASLSGRLPVTSQPTARPIEREERERDEHAAHGERRREQQRPADEDEQDEPDDHQPAVALGLRRRAGRAGAPASASFGHEQDGGEVEQRAGAAEERQDDERDADEDRVDGEVRAEAAGDAGEDAVAARAQEAARRRGACSFVASVGVGRSGCSGGGGVVDMGAACRRTGVPTIGNGP